MATPKTYVKGSSAKEHEFANGDRILKLSFKAKELREFINDNVNPKGYINLIVSKRRAPGQFGDTHSISLDTWQPKGPAGQQATPATHEPPPQDNDPVPF